MPILDADAPLTARPRRILLAGTSGAGKSTLARTIAARIDAPYIEIDALFHGPRWSARESFLADVAQFAAQPGSVTEWQYDSARPVLAERADLVVWLDLPRLVVMRQVIARTVRRRVRREELWNGNLEPPLRAIFTDREYIVRWAWSTHHRTAERIAELAARQPELPIVRLRRRAHAAAWLEGPLRQSTGPGPSTVAEHPAG